MNTYLISYDLNKTGKDYTGLIARIKKLFGTWWHHLDSVWVVKTDYTAVEIRDDLKAHIDSDDELLVVKLSGEGAWCGFIDKGATWLRQHL